MEEQILKFRVLVQLSNQLSDFSRKELHFIVGSIVPRKLRDDCTPPGTLHLLEFLFDCALISEQRFDYLIHALHQIGCHDAVERLEEFERVQRQRTSSTASSSLPLLNESISNIEVDKLANVSIDVGREISCSFSTLEKPAPNSDCPLISSATIVSTESLSSVKVSVFPENKGNQLSPVIRKGLKAQFNTLAILLLVTNILFILLFSLFFFLRTCTCPKLPHSSRAPSISQDLNYIVKEGFWHGIEGKLVSGQSFDDAKDLGLSYADRCIGVEVYWVNKYLASIRFFYSNGRSSTVHRPPNDHQLDRFHRSSNNFTLDPNEEINKVIFYERAYRTSTNDSLKNVQITDGIVGMQFRTTKGRKSDLFGSDDGKFTAEAFTGYIFYYAKGRQHDAKRVEMLQLIWLKPSSTREKIDETPTYMLDTCSFSYATEKDLELKHATGVETSWYDLKREFNRRGESCRPGASYYRTISVEGPPLFAVVKDTFVWYHNYTKWNQDHNVENVTFGVIHSSDLHPQRVRVNVH